MSDEWSGTGYDVEAQSGSGLWLRLKEKGEKVRLRIASLPCLYKDSFEDRVSGETTVRKKVSWIAIQKEIVGGQPTKRVVIFTGGPMIYGALKDLHDDESWGNPQNYDVTIERTEQPGKYYVVTPLPRPMGPIPDDELEMIRAANIDWPAVCLKDRAVSSRVAPSVDETDPFADE